MAMIRVNLESRDSLSGCGAQFDSTELQLKTQVESIEYSYLIINSIDYFVDRLGCCRSTFRSLCEHEFDCHQRILTQQCMHCGRLVLRASRS